LLDGCHDACLVEALRKLQGSTKPDLHLVPVCQTCSFGHRGMGPFDPDRNNADLRKQCQPPYATLERLELAILAACALREKQDAVAVLEKPSRTMEADEAPALKREGINQQFDECAFPPAGKEIVGSGSGTQA
jgi:hypothetical protein